MIQPHEVYPARAKETLSVLTMYPKGCDIGDLTTIWGCSRQWARWRVNEARAYLRLPEGVKLNVCIPRPTESAGWRYALTNVDVSGDTTAPSIVRSEIDDFKALYAMSIRIASEKKVAYDNLPSKKSAKARQYKVEWTKALADAAYYEDQLQTLIERNEAV